MNNDKALLIVISGYSGVGKGTVRQLVMDALPYLQMSVSCTSRAPRLGEEHGEDYYFLSEEDFKQKIANNEFLEYTKTFTNYYGTLKSEIDRGLAKGIDILLELNVVGASKIKEIYPESVNIFITPPSLDALKARLVGRGSESEDSLNTRLKEIENESLEIHKYDYVVTNVVARTCAEEIVGIIQTEHLKVDRNTENIFNT